MSSASKEDKLPSEWKLCKSKKYPDKWYYFNQFTGVSSWTCPKGEIEEKAKEKKDKTDSSKMSRKVKYPNKTSTVRQQNHSCNPHRFLHNTSVLGTRQNSFKRKSDENFKHNEINPSKNKILKTSKLASKVKTPTKTSNVRQQQNGSFNLSSSPHHTSTHGTSFKRSDGNLKNDKSSSKKIKNKNSKTTRVKFPNKTSIATQQQDQSCDPHTSSSNTSVHGIRRYIFKGKSEDSLEDDQTSRTQEVKSRPSNVDSPTNYKQHSKYNIEKGEPGSFNKDESTVVSQSCQETLRSSNFSFCNLFSSENFTKASEDVDMLDVSSENIHLPEVAENGDKSNVFSKNMHLPAVNENVDKSNILHIVVDTNIFVGHLQFIDKLKDMNIKGLGQPHIYTPWVVTRELDKLKFKKTKGAHEAVRYLYNKLVTNHKSFCKQTCIQESEGIKMTESDCNDDKIIEFCLTLEEKVPKNKLILLSEDIALCLKATNIGIKALNIANFQKDIKEHGLVSEKTYVQPEAPTSGPILLSPVGNNLGKTTVHSLFEATQQLLKTMLEPFFVCNMKEAYGEAWQVMAKQPYTLDDLIKYITKYWSTIFHFKLTASTKADLGLFKKLPTELASPEKEECLKLLDAVERVYYHIKDYCQSVSLDSIQILKVQCNIIFDQLGRISLNTPHPNSEELQSVHGVFDYIWCLLNQLCGNVAGIYGLPYENKFIVLPSLGKESCGELLSELLPTVHQLKRYLEIILRAPKEATFCQLHQAMRTFPSSLKLEVPVISFQHFTKQALTAFCCHAENRETLTNGCMQVQYFYSILQKVVDVALNEKARMP